MSDQVKEVSRCCGADFVWHPYADAVEPCYICTKCGLVCQPWLIENPPPTEIQCGAEGGKDLKKKGSDHYKTDGVEFIDLIRDGGMLTHFALASIIKYAFRNRRGMVNPKDMEKIIHYAEMLLEWECKAGPKCS